jgi:hypothetical protein
MECLENEEKVLAPHWEAFERNPLVLPRPLAIWAYKERSRYAEQIGRFLAVFPREQLLVVTAEELFARPAETLNAMCGFLGVDPWFKGGDFKPVNVGSIPRQTDTEARAFLAEYFRPHNARLYELLGRDFGWDAPPSP